MYSFYKHHISLYDIYIYINFLGGFGAGMRIAPQMAYKGRGGEQISSFIPLTQADRC